MRRDVAGGDLEVGPADGAGTDAEEQLPVAGLRVRELAKVKGPIGEGLGMLDLEGAHVEMLGRGGARGA